MRVRLVRNPLLIVILMLGLTALACNGVDDVIGQRPAAPTPTVPPFATSTPGGRISVPLGTLDAAPTSAVYGQVIAPAATATALYATLAAATALANTTPIIAQYRTRECPAPAAPLVGDRPLNFNQYPEVIGRYLSSGGAPAILEATLRNWKTIADGAVIQTDTDLTGDGVPEFIITLYDPAFYQPGVPAAGAMLVYGCESRGYKLLFSTSYAPDTMIPILRRVGDMNGDIRPELAYSQYLCSNGRCAQTMQILTWAATLGAFKPLNEVPILTTNGKIGISDVDTDGNLEISVVFDGTSDPNAGPPRRRTEIWDWDGASYRLAVIQQDEPAYRIHVVHDADYQFGLGEYRAAIRGYDRARDNAELLSWTNPNEPTLLRAYAGMRKVVALIASGNRRTAGEFLTQLQAENPPASPGEGYAIIAATFLDNYNTKGRRLSRACPAALQTATTRPEVVVFLNSYGYGNRTYTLSDLCPFVALPTPTPAP